ncbi:hypothetical protein BMS3Bbin04_01061 [bacterium BMS3Bbin04]|nr:hypothetical protein BMS3Bbin04_01061 [bacterium BMS3Bbin04]
MEGESSVTIVQSERHHRVTNTAADNIAVTVVIKITCPEKGCFRMVFGNRVIGEFTSAIIFPPDKNRIPSSDDVTIPVIVHVNYLNVLSSSDFR